MDKVKPVFIVPFSTVLVILSEVEGSSALLGRKYSNNGNYVQICWCEDPSTRCAWSG